MQSKLSTAFVSILISVIGNSAFAQSNETNVSLEFRNGVAVGQAIEAVSTTVLYMELLTDLGSAPQKSSGQIEFHFRQRLLSQLLHNAMVIHKVIELPDSVFPKKSSFKKRLTAISDYLHKKAPEMMDLKRYSLSREEMSKLYGGNGVGPEIIEQYLVDQANRKKIVSILTNYSSTAGK